MDSINRLITGFAGHWSVDFRSSNGAVYYHYQATHQLPAASLIKLFLAWQWYTTNQPVCNVLISEPMIVDWDGSLAHDLGIMLASDQLIQRMLNQSENNATNLILAQLGGINAANMWLQQHGYQATSWGRVMLDFQARQHGFDNYTSAQEVTRLLHTMTTTVGKGGLMASTLVKSLVNSASDDKIVAGLPPTVVCAHKSGELDDVEHDAALIYSADTWDSLVIMAAAVPDPSLARQQIRELTSELWHNKNLLHPTGEAGMIDS
ncbi:serine hydrolase [Herpetosiphon sp. NSE202]|uniref:serine hydrolase n=1 Tax=Herpetosiphon sp. NSE202 TaxID=3351349 RepID=UPI00363B8788